MLLASVKLETEDRGLDNIEHWRERAALTKSTGGFEEVSSLTIYKRGDPRGFDTGLDPSDKPRIKPKAEHDLKEKVVVYSIKGICKIKLDSHTCFLSSLPGVDCFLYKKDIVIDLPASYKSALILINGMRGYFFEPVRDDFCEDFV